MDINKIKLNPNTNQKILEQHPEKGRCSSCEWEGELINCHVETETESWEMSHIKYITFFCPVCNEEIDNFY